MTERPDVVSARLAAKAQGSRVEVLGARTESSSTFVNPDGSFTSEFATGPVRVQRPDGAWADLDLNLVEGAEGLAPKASPVPVVFSAGGSGPLATATVEGRSLAMRWPGGTLPKPQVSGNVATYSLSASQDLVVEATRSGFEQSVVLKSRPAAGSVPRVSLPLSMNGLELKPTGGGGFAFTATKASGSGEERVEAGEALAALPEPVMYSAETDPKTGEPTQVETLSAVVGKASDGKTPALTLAPDADGMAFLQDPDTVYPVTIDPVIASVPGFGDTWVQNGSTTPQYASPYLRIGNQSGTTRALVRFQTDGLSGTHVTSATLKLWQHVANTCTPTTMYAYPIAATYTNTSVVWSNQPAINSSTTYRGSASFSHGFDNTTCPRASGTVDVTNMVNGWTSGAIPSHGIELRAGVEADTAYAKAFCSFDSPATGTCAPLSRVPTLSVTYNTYPGTPASVTHRPKATGTNGTVYATSPTPAIEARVPNTDGAPVRLNAEVSYDPAYPGDGSGVVWSGASAPVPAGAVASVLVPSGLLAEGKHYQYRVRGSVTNGAGGTDYGAWSAVKPMVVDTTVPAAPTVSCAAYPSGAWTAPASAAVSCTLDTTASDGSGYYWSLDDPSPSTLVADTTNTGAAQTISIEPGLGRHTLYVRSRDVALNLSSATGYTFGVGAGAVITPDQETQTRRAVALTAQSGSSRTKVTYSYRAGTDGALPWITVPPAHVTPPGSSTPIGSWPQSGTVSGAATDYSQLNWNVAATIAAAGGSDGVIELRACFTDAAGADEACSPTRTIALAKTAFSATAATTEIGPGHVSLVTGDLAVDETDVSVGGLSIGRTHTSLSPAAANSGPKGIFGPGWVASELGPEAGATDQVLTDHSADGYVVLTDTSGTQQMYTRSGSAYVGIGDAADGSVLVKSTTIQNPADSGDTTAYTGWKLTDVDGTLTYWLPQATSGPGSDTYLVKWVDEPGTEGETAYTRDGAGRITRILAAPPPGVSCATMVAGCRALTITYATSTTATGTDWTQWGDYAGQVKRISYTAYNPATSAMATIPVAEYAYDSTGHLRGQWDPRITPNLKTDYAYNDEGRLQMLAPPGREPWVLVYEDSGRLSQVTRNDPAHGNAIQSVVYDIQLSGSGTPLDMTAAQTTTWGQATDLPFLGAAVFPASRVPGRDGPGGEVTPSADDWEYAVLTYLDIDGRAVNTASYGAGAWQIDTARYDTKGNTIWELTAANRAQALNPTEDTDAYVRAQDSSAARADLLATVNTYTPDGADLLTTTGPAHRIWRESGESVSARVRTTHTYDQGAPTANSYHLVTTTTTTTLVVDGSTIIGADPVQTLTGYNPIDSSSVTGPTSGWTLRQPTTVTTVMGSAPSSADIVQRIRYDEAGRAIESRMPESNGTDAGATLTTYYTSDTSASVTACRSKPQWAGLLCQVAPAAQPAGTTIPTTTTTAYTIWDAPATVAQSSGSTTRTRTTTFDDAGRPTVQSLTVTPATDGGTAVPDTTTSYHPDTGDVTSVTAAGATIATEFDSLGRVISYTDADGATTATTYTIDGQVATRTDGQGTYTYDYDGTDAEGRTERRGLVTSLNVGMGTAPSTFTAAYDEDGNLTRQIYPNGITAVTAYDNTGDAFYKKYSKGSYGWMEYGNGADREGRTVYATSPLGAVQYGYDNNDRLISVADTDAGQCTTRSYTFSKNGNRTALNTGNPASNGDCQTTITTTRSYSYDSADRITTSGTVYDRFGRTTTLAAADTPENVAVTIGYHADDMTASLTQGTQAKTFTLDPVRRFRQVIDTTSGTETRRIVNHYADGSDSPAWISTSTDANATYTWERNVEGIDGDLAVIQTSTGTTTLQFTNLHGDIIATADNDPNVPSTNAYFESTEYGTPRTTNDTNPTRYAWLGAKQRSTDTLAGLILMGVRLYNPSSGRFLSLDPFPGGNENAYNYPNDPVNKFDLDGQIEWGKWIDRAGTGLAVAGLFGCGACAAGAAAISLGRGLYKLKHNDRSGFIDIAGAVTFGAARGLNYANKVKTVREIRRNPKAVKGKGKAKQNKKRRKAAKRKERAFNRRYVRRADNIDRTYSTFTVVYSGYNEYGQWRQRTARMQ